MDGGAMVTFGAKVRILVCALAALAVPAVIALPAKAAVSRHGVVYYQTQYDGSRSASPLGLTQHQTHVTDVLVAALHLDANKVVHLNDDPPSAAKFSRMWKDLAAMRAGGVHVLVMVGGAAGGSFRGLDTRFGTDYPVLRNVIGAYHLDGGDLDGQEAMSLAGLERAVHPPREGVG